MYSLSHVRKSVSYNVTYSVNLSRYILYLTTGGSRESSFLVKGCLLASGGFLPFTPLLTQPYAALVASWSVGYILFLPLPLLWFASGCFIDPLFVPDSQSVKDAGVDFSLLCKQFSSFITKVVMEDSTGNRILNCF